MLHYRASESDSARSRAGLRKPVCVDPAVGASREDQLDRQVPIGPAVDLTGGRFDRRPIYPAIDFDRRLTSGRFDQRSI